MALIIGGGITVGGNITITNELINPTANLVLFYDAGNSMCYSGSGIQFNTSYTGPNLDTYQQYGVLDLAGITGGPWNSGIYAGDGPMSWTSRGVGSYWTLDGTNYIDSTYQQNENPTLTSPTYTIVSVVRPQDWANGAIVGGDEQVFAFTSNGGLDDGPSLAAGNSYGPPDVIDTTTAYELDTWYCVAVTYDSDTGIMKLYTNGVLVDTANGVNSITHPTGLYWGTLEGVLWYTGDMAVCMAYERVLGVDEISQLSDVYLSRYIPPAATSSIVFDQPWYVDAQPVIWTVPEGVNSISVVAVGAGGGGTQNSYSPPGGDSVMLLNNTPIFANVSTSGGYVNTLNFDSSIYPDIMNVTDDGSWLVQGLSINTNLLNSYALVVQSFSSGSNEWTIVLERYIPSVAAGDQYAFYQAAVAAEGGYEINLSNYSSNPEGFDLTGWAPGARAKPLITDGPYGEGGVVDWTDTWPIGGGGAGGYGIEGLAWNINQAGEWYYLDAFSIGYQTMSFTNNNLTVNGLVGANTINVQNGTEVTVIGTQTIPNGAKVMYSLNVSQVSGVADYCGVGLSNYNQNLWDYIGNTGNNSIGYYDGGSINFNGSVVETYANFSEGGIVDIAVDTDVGLVWFRVSGGNWNGGGSADPATGVGGFDISALITQGLPISVAATPFYNAATSTGDIISIATTSYYTVPSGYTFVPGVPGAGGTGGDGAADYGPTAMPGTGGSSGGGGGRLYDSGAGGGGTGLYGRGTSGTAGSFVDTDTNLAGVATGGGGGSNNTVVDGKGGQATPWNGGRGGYPGGGGGSATDYYDGGNGGALAYVNNYAVTPGDEFIIIVGEGGQGQNNGGSGAHGTIRIIWPGDTRQFPSTNCGPDEVSVPTLDITAHSTPSGNPSGSVTWDITSDGGSTVLETGIVWGLPGNDNYLNSVNICDGSSTTAQRSAVLVGGTCGGDFVTGLTGSQTLTFNSYLFDNETINIRAYARNEAGVAYSPTTLTWTPSICLAEGTLITLADGSTKTIENIEMSDSLRVWDFDKGMFTTSNPLWIKVEETTSQYNLLSFSDGSTLKTINQHRIFNKEKGMFTHPMTDDTPIGTTTVNSFGEEVTLVAKSVVQDEVNYYNVVTDYHMNLYANGILTSLRFNNVYPITDMKFVKDDRVLRSSEFSDIDSRWVNGLRLQEQTYTVEFIQKYIARLEQTEQETCYA